MMQVPLPQQRRSSDMGILVRVDLDVTSLPAHRVGNQRACPGFVGGLEVIAHPSPKSHVNKKKGPERQALRAFC